MNDYRAQPARCPACFATMEERAVGDALVDVCPGCRGLWLDWFDGDTVTVAADVAPLSHREPVALDAARATCPRCHANLQFVTPAVEPHAAEAATRMGAVLLRCGECAGTFVPRAAFDELVELRWHTAQAPDPRGALARVMDAIKALFSPSPSHEGERDESDQRDS